MSLECVQSFIKIDGVVLGNGRITEFFIRIARIMQSKDVKEEFISRPKKSNEKESNQYQAIDDCYAI